MERVLMRLNDKERETLQLLLAALRVSEYTDDVDDFRLRSRREEKMLPAIQSFFAAVTGLTVAASELPSAVRRELEQERPVLSMLEPLLCNAFEIARRHKRLNPHHHRSEFGKLVMILQDASHPRRLEALGLRNLVTPVLTVGAALHRIGASALLEDPGLTVATSVAPTDMAAKQAAIAALVDKYGGVGAATSNAPTGDSSTAARRHVVEQAILSIGDSVGFLRECVSPIERLMTWLEKYFGHSSRSSGGPAGSLDIRRGKNGSCLTHDHDTQVAYVRESLVLWRIIQRDIFELWQTVEEDMVVDCRGQYRFCDTGQGYHRMLDGPKTYQRMQAAVSEARRVVGSWVGITVVHLGDQDVPNALVFIDKYTIIPKMLAPIVQTIERIDQIFESTHEDYPGIRNLLKSKYESGAALKTMILQDFFRHAFDGSGDDGGSCIDGRLTSAWNWCHQLHKKTYYDAFVLTGFTGFDG